MAASVRGPACAVLNRNDIARPPALAMLASMPNVRTPPERDAPDPWARAPRLAGGEKAAHARLQLAPRDLQGVLLCVIHRDTRDAMLSDAQRLSHLPI